MVNKKPSLQLKSIRARKRAAITNQNVTDQMSINKIDTLSEQTVTNSPFKMFKFAEALLFSKLSWSNESIASKTVLEIPSFCPFLE